MGADTLIEAFVAAKERHRDRIEPHIGKLISVSGQTWELADWNDLGILYWRKYGKKKLYTLYGYRIIECVPGL